MLLKNKVEIEQWLNKYKIKNYELIEDIDYGYVVNVNGDIDLFNKGLKSIDVKFGIIDGWFDCGDNELTSLVGCPKIVNGIFYCNNNKLKIKEIKNLIEVEIQTNYINIRNNENLGEIQKITDINEVKKILTIYEEKAAMMNLIEKEIIDKSVESAELVSAVIINKSIKQINKI